MFKIDDRVRCVAHDAGGLVYGSEYTVVDITEEFVYVIREEGYRGGYFPSRFELVAKKKPKQYICDTEWSWYIADSIEDIPESAVRVWELGDELVKRVTWEKKEADQ